MPERSRKAKRRASLRVCLSSLTPTLRHRLPVGAQRNFQIFLFHLLFIVHVDTYVSLFLFATKMSFLSIPILDLSLARNPESKPAFLDSLRNALLDVGFLYIKSTGIEDALIRDVISQGKAFFDLPEEKKLEIQMKNVPSFLGGT